MKTILLVTLLWLTGVNCYAQACNCPKKTAAHHKLAKKTTKKLAPAACTHAARPEVVIVDEPQLYDNATTKDYCPANFPANNGCLYDNNSGVLRYMIENSFSGNYPLPDVLPVPERSLVVTSPAFNNYGAMPQKYSCEGQEASPPLHVSNIPAGTRSLTLVLTDPQANSQGGETYWMIWDLDTTGDIPENFVNNHESLNVAGQYGYHGVCPAAGTHYYHFMVYALDTKLTGNKHTTRRELESAMRGHILARGELVGVYDKL